MRKCFAGASQASQAKPGHPCTQRLWPIAATTRQKEGNDIQEEGARMHHRQHGLPRGGDGTPIFVSSARPLGAWCDGGFYLFANGDRFCFGSQAGIFFSSVKLQEKLVDGTSPSKNVATLSFIISFDAISFAKSASDS